MGFVPALLPQFRLSRPWPHILGFFLVGGAMAWIPPAGADVAQQVPVGPRAIGMGGAFTSIADDASAQFWNPAGLARIGHQEITGTQANLFDSGIRDNYAAFALPLSLRHTVALDWYHSGFDDPELSFGENRFDLSYARTFGERWSAGVTAKYLSRSTDLDGATVSRGAGAGLDVGVLFSPLDRLRVGVVAQDLTGTFIDDPQSGSSVVYPMNLRLGTSYAYRRLGSVAFDIDDRWHLGVELTPLEQVALRAGFEDDREGSEAATVSYGAGFKIGGLRLDYALVDHPTLSSTHHFGVAMEFNFNPSQVRIERVQARDLYASLYKSYAREGIGTVTVRNLVDAPVTARVQVFVPELMERPSEQDVVLRPRAVQEVELPAVMSERVLSRSGDRPVQVQVSASYQSRRLMRTEKSSTRCLAYGPGAIDWGAGVAQAAAFVTLDDPSVDALAREATGIVARAESTPFGNRNLAFAAALVDALGVLGVAYVPDPNNPFTAISETPHAVDTIHYPAQTLDTRVGDCDDTTVLMASLLGNVGIPTRLVDAPGHVFLLLDSGVHARNRLAFGVDEAMTVVSDEEVWVPLETTALAKGFAEAWRIGAETYARLAPAGRLAVVDVAEAQARYAPAVPPARPRAATLDATALTARIQDDAARVADWRSQFASTHYGDAQKAPVSAAGLIQVAHVYFLAGKLDAARLTLEDVLRRSPRSASALNDLAGLDLVAGDARRAVERCEAALAIDPDDPGVRLNYALAHQAAGDNVAAERALAEAVARSGGADRAWELLGVRPGDVAQKAGDVPSTLIDAARGPAPRFYWKP